MTRLTLTLTCDHCGAIARRHLTDYEHEALVLPAWQADLATEGWAFAARDTCPACVPVPLTITEEIRA